MPWWGLRGDGLDGLEGLEGLGGLGGLDGCLGGLRAELLLLRGVDWSRLRATSFSVRATMGDGVFEEVHVVVEAADVQGGVVGQVDVRSQDAVPGDAAVDPVDGVWVEVSPGQQHGHPHFAVG